ncbi:uncharacterized protein PG986_010406 [Apiospora aurea]|uniref:DUF676 domain-containing protein n=1 Tax=Apiospora aurea TaxID=335848 RepID=A0ABR1Q252_9PEZI
MAYLIPALFGLGATQTMAKQVSTLTSSGLQQLASGGTIPQVDIVFVHGLRGSSIGTWSRRGICWPRDLLKDDLPNARVLTFGWDTRIANATTPASQDSLFGHAGTLLQDLRRFRGDNTYPVIFIAHSLGGLLVKQMLIKAATYQRDERHGSLGNPSLYTKGIVFMGTPHRGSDAQSYGQFLAKIASATMRQPNTQLLEVLRRDSAILESQRDDFVGVSKKFDVVCFREELPTGIGLIVPAWPAVYEGDRVEADGIHANHKDMTKFSSAQDTGYQRVLHHIQLMKTSSDASQAHYKQKDLDLLYDSKNDDEQWGYSTWIHDGYLELIHLLSSFQNNPYVKICVTSRELSSFEDHFCDKLRIRVQEHTAAGIIHYCRMRLEQQTRGRINSTALDELSKEVSDKTEGVFLWVRIVVDRIVYDNGRGKDAHQLRTRVQSLPEKLGRKDGLYWHMIQQIPGDELQHASRMLYIMVESKSDGRADGSRCVDLFQLHCAAQAVSGQQSPPDPPNASELQNLRRNVAQVITRDNDDKDALFGYMRQLQSHCCGMLETYISSCNGYDNPAVFLV